MGPYVAAGISPPTGLTLTVVSATQINLSWTAPSTGTKPDDYHIEHCSGSGCSGFDEIATPTATSYSNTGLTCNTSYSYRVLSNKHTSGGAHTGSGSDSSSYTATASATTSACANTAPTANAQSVSTNEDTALVITLTGSDPETCNLVFSIVTSPSNGSLGALTNIACTAGTPNTDSATVTYTPNANYNGSDSFTFKVNDGTVDSSAATVSITVNAVNDAPVAVADSYSTDEDTALVVAAPGVLGNDSDVDGDSLTAVNVTNPANGTLTLNANGSFTYTPASNYNGSDSFTYKANDGTVDSNTVTVSITVNAVNDAPVAVADSYSTDEDTALVVAAPGVLGNDSDVDGDSLTAVNVTNPANGTLTLNANGSFTYTPASNYNGSDSFTYKANDGTVDSNTVTVSITVNAVNDAPVVSNDLTSQTVQYSDPIATVTITATDVDSPGSLLTASASFTKDGGASQAGLPTGLTLAVNTTSANSRTWTVSGNVLAAPGTYVITVKVTDDLGAFGTTSFTIVVTKEDAAIVGFAPTAIQVDGTDGDIDSLTVTMTIEEENDGSLSGTGLANAQPIVLTLAPIGAGPSYICTATSTTYVSPGTATASCTMSNVTVNVYEASATIQGDYFIGSGLGAVTVYDPALGFATGGGWFRDAGNRVNFGFNVKFLNSGNMKGSLLTIVRKPEGNYIVKSNAMGIMAIKKDSTNMFWTATFNGKATYQAPATLGCGSNKCGNYQFTVYVEDRKEPGAGYDRFWLQLKDPSGNIVTDVSFPTLAPANAKTIEGGNIQVPQPQGK